MYGVLMFLNIYVIHTHTHTYVHVHWAVYISTYLPISTYIYMHAGCLVRRRLYLRRRHALFDRAPTRTCTCLIGPPLGHVHRCASTHVHVSRPGEQI